MGVGVFHVSHKSLALAWALTLPSAISALCADLPASRATKDSQGTPANLEITFSGTAMSDYYYRGTTLSAHRPSVAAWVSAQFGWFYLAGEAYSVKLPTNPLAEIVLSGGIRPKIGPIELDFALIYFLYPRERPDGRATETDYWEANGKVSHKLTSTTSIGAELAYAPSISNSGAWATYAAGKIRIDLPTASLPNGVNWYLSADLGHYWFGSVAPVFGGFALPSYTHWRAGVAFTYGMFTLDLSYHDTNLAREDCTVFTGDPGATPGGRINQISNPQGLRSNWCGAAFIATLSFELKHRNEK